MKRYVAVLLVGVLLAGCSKQKKPEAVKPEQGKEVQALADSFDLFMQVDTLCMEGSVDEAIDTLNKALADDAYMNNRPWVFAKLLNVMLGAGRVDEARAIYLEGVATDEDLARGGFNVIYDHYLRAGDADALVEWTGMLIAISLPDDLAQQAFAWHMEACRRQGSFDRVIELVPVCVSRFDDHSSANILAGLIQALVGSEQYGEAARLLSVVDEESANRPELQRLGAISKTDLLFLQGRWVEAEKQFLNVAPSLSEDELVGCLHRESVVAIKAGQLDLVDRLCGFVLRSRNSREGARREAAIQCMAVGRVRNDVIGMVQRFESLLDLDLPPADLLSLYGDQFDFIMQNGKKDDLEQVLRFSDRLAPLLSKEDSKEQIACMALDLSFVTEDYERALKILDEPCMTNRDKECHDMAVNKIKAHIALSQGNKKEAVERFRKFMDYVSGWETPEYDPSTGLLHTSVMCLGFNAKRIGDILNSMGDEKGAGEAYEEARAYYEQALKETVRDNKEYAYIEAELGKIPTQKKNP